MDRWSEGNQIYFLNDRAFAVSPELQTINLGDEVPILDALKNNKSMGNPVIDNILTSEINCRGKDKTAPRARMRRQLARRKI